MERLRLICDSEKISVDSSALELIARQGTGSVRDSISLLDQIVVDPNEYVSFELAQSMLGSAGEEYVWELAQAIAEGDVAYGINEINKAVDTGADPRQFGRQLIDHLRKLLLIKMGSGQLVNTSEDLLNGLIEQAEYFDKGLLLKSIRAFNSALDNMRGGWQPQLPLELAMVETTLQPVTSAPQETTAPRQNRANLTPRRQRAAPKAPESQVPATQKKTTLTVDDFYHRWDEFCEVVINHNQRLEPQLQYAFPLRVDDKILCIGVDKPTFKDQLVRKQDVLTSVAQTLFGEGYEIAIEVANSQFDTSEYDVEDEVILRAMKELGAIPSPRKKLTDKET